jgi:glycosidase
MAHLVTLDFWIEARTALDKVKPLFWLAETEDPTYHKAFDATYTWEWMHATTRFVKEGLSVATLDKVLYRYHDDFPPFSHRLYFTSNHDENSWNGTEYEKYGPAALPLAVFAATWNGIPLLYSGQELPNLQRLPFFDKAAIDWCSDCQLHHFYKTLFNMRRRDAVLRSGDKAEFTFRLNTNHDRVMMYLRTRGEQQVLVVLNFTGEAQAVSLADHRVMGRFTNVFTQHAVDIDKHKHLPLLPWGYLVLEKLQH